LVVQNTTTQGFNRGQHRLKEKESTQLNSKKLKKKHKAPKTPNA
jgi:hypothetical protein